MPNVQSIDEARLLAPDAGRTPQMEDLWRWICEDDAKDPDFGRTLNAQEGRALSARLNRRWNVELPEMAAVEAFSLPGLPGAPAIAAEMFTPPDDKPGCVLFLHGGGWAYGNLRTHERTMRLLAQETRMRVMGVDYRLAPEHPFPQPLEDCVAAWRWLKERSRHEAGLQGPLAVAGDSAGANLALATMLWELRLNRPTPDAGLLFYGIYSNDLESPSYKRFGSGYGLTQQSMANFFDWYAPGLGPDAPRRDPMVHHVGVSEETLARLPPLFLNAAGLDVLLCDTLAMARRLEAAGAVYELEVHEGVHHGFLQYSARLEEARRAVRLAAGFLGRRMRA